MEIHHVATPDREAIAAQTLIDLAFHMFGKTGILMTVCYMWCVKLEAEKMLAKFKMHFNHEKNELLCKLIAGQAGYQGVLLLVH